MTNLRNLAQLRVDNSPELQKYETIIMYDWPEGDEHWNWVLTEKIELILEWAHELAVPEKDEW